MKNIYSQISKVGLIALLSLSACSDEDAEIAEAQEAALVGNKIECALNGTEEFTASCATERVASDEETILMIRHNDGGFRRFRLLTDGRGLETAEGFDNSRIDILDDEYIILSSGKDRYKLKAQFKSTPKASDQVAAPLANEALESIEQPKPAIVDSEVGPVGTPGAPYPIPE